MSHSEFNIVKEFVGFSGARVYLMHDATKNLHFVRKQGNITRNVEKLKLMHNAKFNVPCIYSVSNELLDMEYIQGMDMKTYLLRYSSNTLVDFIVETINKFKTTASIKNYHNVYVNKLSFIDNDIYIPFRKEELLSRLPSTLEQSLCHGDFTFENIIYSKSNKFFMIDCSTGEYDSWIFDLAKMRQDLDAKWFTRNTNLRLDSSLITIKNNLKEQFPEAYDDNIYILMLLRVYQHAKPKTPEHTMLLTEIKKLWK